MARSDERSEDHEKPSSPTEIFLRSFQSAEAKPGEAADSAPMGEASWPADLRQDASSRPATRAESLPAEDSPGTSSGEFTRLFVRPTPSGEHERLTPLPSMVPPPTVAARAEKAWMPGGKDPASVSSGSPSFPPPSPATSTSASQFFSRDIAKTTAPPATRADTQDPGYGGIEQRPAWNVGTSPEVSEVSELRRSLADEQYAYPKQTRSDRNHDIQWPADPFGGSPPQQSGHQPQNYGAASSPPASSVTVMLDRMALEEARAPFSNASSQTQPAAPPPERPAPYIRPSQRAGRVHAGHQSDRDGADFNSSRRIAGSGAKFFAARHAAGVALACHSAGNAGYCANCCSRCPGPA